MFWPGPCCSFAVALAPRDLQALVDESRWKPLAVGQVGSQLVHFVLLSWWWAMTSICKNMYSILNIGERFYGIKPQFGMRSSLRLSSSLQVRAGQTGQTLKLHLFALRKWQESAPCQPLFYWEINTDQGRICWNISKSFSTSQLVHVIRGADFR